MVLLIESVTIMCDLGIVLLFLRISRVATGLRNRLRCIYIIQG